MYGNLSQACLTELDVAVPFLCSEDISRFQCDAKNDQRLLSCLENNEASLDDRCRDSLSLARDHFLRLHDETNFNLWTPRMRSTCNELLTGAKQKGCTGCVRAAGDWVGRRRVRTASKQCSETGHVFTELTKSSDELQLFSCCPVDFGAAQRKQRMASVTRLTLPGESATSNIDLTAQTALFVILLLVLIMFASKWTPRKILGRIINLNSRRSDSSDMSAGLLEPQLDTELEVYVPGGQFNRQPLPPQQQQAPSALAGEVSFESMD
eukprot:gnl/MRDRNA2_/MRDRNA2_16673_c0_seq2.p1 gnl/MRDRNA2_/MRDRNA2_16673_c0~~gnl/MRDRNA2_/MRDRNA2_16673_c0_seq2.p1  ORF type:complete len:266 (+),score=36.63 gnl/MRDRNA2_/MRDRNA2_16673_c0_seq2:133-930(+)